MSNDVTDATPVSQTGRLERFLAVAALVLILFGAKIMFIRAFGSAVPYWDQWDAEADILYKAYLNSNLSWSALLAPHNEHRILLPRLLSLALFELDGGWDPILQMIVNAALHVVAIVLMIRALQRILDPGQSIALAIFAAVLFVLPIGWENLLAGFQSQFYLLLIFSILALSGFAVAPAFSVRWWFSAACAVAAFFSMASGALIGIAALGIVALQLLLRVRQGKKEEYVSAALLLVTSAMMIACVPHIAGHDGLKAHGLRELFAALLTSLDYPRSGSYVGVPMNLPLLAYAWFILTTRPSRTSPHWVILGLIVWWFGQVLSLSYGRAVAPTSSRYLDITIMAMPINFAILLFSVKIVSPQRQRALFAATVVWLAVLQAGLVVRTSRSTVPSVLEKAEQSREQGGNVAAYLRTGDIATLQNKAMLAIPYPSADRLASLLSDPTIRMALPRAIRHADIDEKALLERTMLRGRSHAAVERTRLTIMNLAPVLLGLGMALALAASLCGRLVSLKDEGAD